MEFDIKYRDDLTFPSTTLQENHMKVGFKDGFPLDACSSNGYLQDFHQNDQFHVDGLLPNSKSGVDHSNFYQFETLANGSSSNFNIFDSIPLIQGVAMENSQNCPFINFSPRITPEVVITQDRNPTLNFQEFGSPNLTFLPEQVACITADNRYCRKINMKDEWTEEEDKIIIKAHAELGNKWTEIAKQLKGRTGNSIKNYWNATKRKQLLRQRSQSSKHHKSCSLLQSYINNLIETSDIANNESNACTDANMQTLNAMIGPSTQLAESVESFAGDGLVPNYDFSNISDSYFVNTMMFPKNYNRVSTFDEMSGTSVIDEKDFEIKMSLDINLQQCETNRDMDLVEMIDSSHS
ncbi:transcription factor MYB15-like [Telopea speciosissima]|uniref:transcription factor MYB15-like n=1 Tax=Telopea speciosissima TaxID=54955 RepID=UPI001CC69922|nr:transcription factor MYB15-like [Telopea speciosissima]